MATSVNLADDGFATSTSAAATSNHTGVFVTTESLTTASAAAYTIVITDALISLTSIIFASAGWGSASAGGLSLESFKLSAGSVSLVFRNSSGASVNGTMQIHLLVA
jgi:hypothetical protein